MPVEKLHMGTEYNRVYPFAHGHARRCIISENDVFMHGLVSHYGEYSEDEVDVFRSAVQPGDCVLNVGANIGLHTLALAALAHDGSVYAFEPQRLAFQTLCGNIALNSFPHVVCIQAAVGRFVGSLHVPLIWPYVKSNSGGLSMDFTLKSGDVVQLITIDSLHFPALDFLLVDVEGMEADVLAGATASIRRFHPAIYLEANWNQSGVLATLSDFGYRAWHHRPRHIRVPNFLNQAVRPEDEDVVGPVMVLALHPDSSKILTQERLTALGMEPLPTALGEDSQLSLVPAGTG